MYCINCGQILPDKANFCPGCGTKAFSSPESEPVNVEAEPVNTVKEEPEAPSKTEPISQPIAPTTPIEQPIPQPISAPTKSKSKSETSAVEDAAFIAGFAIGKAKKAAKVVGDLAKKANEGNARNTSSKVSSSDEPDGKFVFLLLAGMFCFCILGLMVIGFIEGSEEDSETQPPEIEAQAVVDENEATPEIEVNEEPMEETVTEPEVEAEAHPEEEATTEPEEEVEALPEGAIKIEFFGSQFDWEPYEQVVETLKAAGFTNVKTEPIYDLSSPEPLLRLDKRGSVEDVVIAGEKHFLEGDVFQADDEVIVYYHMCVYDDTSISYTSYSVATLINDLESNAMRAKDKHQFEYVEITGCVDSIDASGDYFCLSSSKNSWDFVNVQCHIYSDEHKNKLMDLTVGKNVTVRGRIALVGETIGYSIDVYGIN